MKCLLHTMTNVHCVFDLKNENMKNESMHGEKPLSALRGSNY